MGRRYQVAIALGTAILLAALASPVPASNNAPSPASSPTPTAGPTLAPIDADSTAAPATSSGPGQPKLLGHVYTSAYCSNFVEHFNTAARGVIDNDQHMDAVDADLHKIEYDWDRTDGAMRVYDDRVSLIASVNTMLKSIPVTQAAVNQLLAQAKETTDPARKAALLESASQLQKTLDRQRAVTYDLSNVIHVLLDKHKKEDMGETAIYNTQPAGFQYVGVSLLDDPVPEPGQDSIVHNDPSPSPSPGATPKAGSVEDILQWTRQRSIIGTAESKAAVAADRVVRICNQESDASTQAGAGSASSAASSAPAVPAPAPASPAPAPPAAAPSPTPAPARL